MATAIAYTPRLLSETGQDAPAAGSLSPQGFLASAPDGRPMGTLLDGALYKAKSGVRAGMTSTDARALAARWLAGTLLTVMADTRRSVVAADIAQRPAVTGYVRMLNAPSCERCVILAGKWFRWNDGFLRHPRCDCQHIPSANRAWAESEGFVSDPYEYFHGLTKDQQEQIFGRSEARAVREGADIYRVVNIKHRGLATAKGAARYGTPSRMTVDDIFRTAGTRTNAIRMLEREGYITGPQVAGGNILGRREGFGQLGKGGRARAASDAVSRARATGVRDPLNRYTMTAAERRLYDAKTRLDMGRSGVSPRSIGANSADVKLAPRSVTPSELATLERVYQAEVDKLGRATPSVRHLAALLGIN